jgi:hypothetical protein
METYMIVDTENGLKIVKCNKRNFFSSDYAVQFIGTGLECKIELARLQDLFN